QLRQPERAPEPCRVPDRPSFRLAATRAAPLLGHAGPDRAHLRVYLPGADAPLPSAPRARLRLRRVCRLGLSPLGGRAPADAPSARRARSRAARRSRASRAPSGGLHPVGVAPTRSGERQSRLMRGRSWLLAAVAAAGAAVAITALRPAARRVARP